MKKKEQTSTAKLKQKVNWQKFAQTPATYFVTGGVLLLLLGGLLAIPKYNDFVEKKTELQKMIAEINGNPENNQFYGKEGELKKIEAQYADKKQAVDKENEEKQSILDKVFPSTEEIYYLTDLLESYAVEHDSATEPFELTNISFANSKAPTAKKGEESTFSTPVAFTEMQINLPLVLSQKNFEEFIHFIEKSGSLEQEDFYGKEKEVPLMTIDSLNFTYTEDAERPNQEIVNANFILTTYLKLNN